MRLFFIGIYTGFILLSGSFTALTANKSPIDSLENVLQKTKGEKTINICQKLSQSYLLLDINKSLEYGNKALEISEQYYDEKQIANSNRYLADIYFEMGHYQKAIYYYEKALDYFYDQRASDPKIYLYTRLGDSEKMLGNLNNALFDYQKPLNLFLAEKSDKISQIYNKIGAVYKQQHKFSDALEYHQKALNEANLALDQKEIANTLNFLGSLYWNNSQYDSSLFYYEKSLEIYRDNSDTLGEAKVLNNIGVVYKDKGEFKKAMDYNSKALELRTEKGSRKDVANSYNNIGSLYLSINDYNNALDFYVNALKIRENIKDISGVAQTQSNIALVYKRIENNKKALEYLNKSLANYIQIGNKAMISSAINQMAGIYKKLNQYDLALENYLKALKLRQEIGDQNEVASILNNIGIIYNDISNYPKALESFNKSLEIKRTLGNKRDIAYALHIIGNTYSELKKYNEALKYYNESLELSKEIGDKVNIASSYKSIGNTYLSLGNYSNSLLYFKDALKLRQEIGDIKGVSDILNDLGNYYNTLGKYKNALDYYNRTINISKKTGDQYLIALCNRKIGVIQLNNGDEQLGVSLIKESLEIGQMIDNLELIKNAYYELYNYYHSKNESKQALAYYLNYTLVKDTIMERFNSQRLVEIQMNFELEKSQNEISRIEGEISDLTTENKIRELELKKQKNVRDLLLVIALIALISGLIILIQYLSKRKTNILLQEKINEVDRSYKLIRQSEDDLKILNATKDKFFSIIAHDLRNPFNALHGLTSHLLNNFDDFTQDEVKQSIEIVYNSADDLLELLENLLHWSRAQRGKMQFDPKKVNLFEIIDKISNLLKMNAQKKEINLVNEVETDKTIFADYDMIMTVLRNLISNAIKFSYSKSFIRISCKEFKDYDEISVMDNGVGINQKDIDKLFRIDVHYSTSGTSEEQGSGLGLILCHEFVEKHQGKIWVESEINKGSTFKFTIPKNIIKA